MYGAIAREFVRTLYTHNYRDGAIATFVGDDIQLLRRVPRINSYAAKSFFPNRYKLPNKETIGKLGRKDARDALQVTSQPLTGQRIARR